VCFCYVYVWDFVVSVRCVLAAYAVPARARHESARHERARHERARQREEVLDVSVPSLHAEGGGA
jgi:hypothetical protein